MAAAAQESILASFVLQRRRRRLPSYAARLPPHSGRAVSQLPECTHANGMGSGGQGVYELLNRECSRPAIAMAEGAGCEAITIYRVHVRLRAIDRAAP